MTHPAKAQQFDLSLTPAQAADPDEVRRRALHKAGRQDGCVVSLKRSLDARKGHPRIHLRVEVRDAPRPAEPPILSRTPTPLQGRVIIVGAGPAGYFAALELLIQGIRPIVLERGKDVRTRRLDLRALMQEGVVNPHSNYCFGEGGAGTYSDGKLYTRSDKRGNIQRVLRLLVEHGACSEILLDSHPHIGSNRLPQVIENMRVSIVELGGEVHFDQHVTDLLLDGDRVLGVRSGGSQDWRGDAVILATGHSARDIFEMLLRQGLTLESQPFAVGVRVEHPQELIDYIQYRQRPRDPFLPPSSYRLVSPQGVWSFCMCPGGLIVPSATAPGEVVVNGMSMSGRNSRWANSGIVTAVTAEDLQPFAHCGPLAGVELQRQLERRAFAANGDGSQRAPAQPLVDFLTQPRPGPLPRSSYVPGLCHANLAEILGPRIHAALVAGFEDFGSKMKAFVCEQAVVVGVESRTSSPVRVPRDDRSFQSPQIQGLYPCGEGSGYAGGIVSAALDGQRAATAIALTVKR